MESSCQTQTTWFTIWWWIRYSWTTTLGKYWFFIDFDLKEFWDLHFNEIVICSTFLTLLQKIFLVFGSAEIPNSSLVWFIFYNLDPPGFSSVSTFVPFVEILWNCTLNSIVLFYSVQKIEKENNRNNKTVCIYRTTSALFNSPWVK